MLIRPETPADGPAVAALHAADADRLGGARLRGSLVAPLCLVAEVGGEVVGHTAVCRAEPDGLVWLGPVVVAREAQGRGIGTALVHSVLAAAEALWFAGVLTEATPDRGEGFGFEPAAHHGLAADGIEPGGLLVRPLPSAWPGGYPAGTTASRPGW